MCCFKVLSSKEGAKITRCVVLKPSPQKEGAKII